MRRMWRRGGGGDGEGADGEEVDKEMEDAEVEGLEEERACGGEEVVNEEEVKLEEAVQVEGAEGGIGDGDVETVDSTGTVRRKFVYVVPTHIPQRCKAYDETVNTAPPRDLCSMSRTPLSMQPSTAESRLYTVEGFLKWCMVPKKHRENVMLSLEDLQHVRKMAWIWGCVNTVVGVGGTGSDWDVCDTSVRL